MKLIDSHAHLQFPEFKTDYEDVIKRAQEAGVEYFLIPGTNNDTSWQAIEFAKKYDFCYAAVGIHPHEARRIPDKEMMEFEGWLKDPKVVAVGEIGLDFYRNLASPVEQRQTLINFFTIAMRTKKPIILHVRDAYPDMIQILKDHMRQPVKGLIHCFSGTSQDLEQLVVLGLSISFSATVTYPKTVELREAVKICPLDRILIETDSPYLPPQSKRGKRNEPAYVAETAATIAEIKGISVEELGERTVKNFCSLFNIK